MATPLCRTWGMELTNFRIAIALAMNKHPDWRLGQAAFSVLAEHRPDLAQRVRGKSLDPSHARKVDDRRFVAFVKFLEENW